MDFLGSGAVAKTEHGTRMDVIGNTIDLNTERVLIASKNFLTALHGFITTDVVERVNLRSAQRLASWATRYGKICRVMRPFCGALYTGSDRPVCFIRAVCRGFSSHTVLESHVIFGSAPRD